MDGFVYLAYDYPVLGLFWTVLWFFLWVLWLVVLFRVITDIFRDRDMNGWAKTAWLLFVLVVPFLGALVYVIARGQEMGIREAQHAQEQRKAFDEYVREAAGRGPSTAEELAKLSELKAGGVISDEDYARAKERILS
ncbi:SHOCT domain-containing protein [Streptomyces sp. NPDC051776]|uniref:SHOCT domain-containing protein n=1 Tax=Streptomyces sp. NPDC051776 TaxID=3155414 RepID=UPI00341556B1